MTDPDGTGDLVPPATDGASRLAHGLRTPLSSLELRLRRLRQIDAGGDAADLLAGALADVREIERLLDDSLALGRATRVPLAEEVVNVDPSLSRVADRMSELAAARGARLEVESSGGLHAMGNGRAVEQVLVNLCDNALRHSGTRRAVRLGARARDGRVEIAVADDGIGIAAEDAGRVREPYFKVDREARGSGLGLTIASELATAMGGALRITSEPGRGTTVTLELRPSSR